MYFLVPRRNLTHLLKISREFRLFTSPGLKTLIIPSNRSLFPRRTSVRWLRLNSQQSKPPSLLEPPKPVGYKSPRRPPWISGMAAFVAFSTGISLAIAYYLSRVAKPTEVSYRVFEELLARGEVRSIQVSQSRKYALVRLHSPQMVDGKAVFVSFIANFCIFLNERDHIYRSGLFVRLSLSLY